MSSLDEHPDRIYHIANPRRWLDAAERRLYAAPSLEVEGFIHCSLAHQVQRSLDRFFSAANEVAILEIDPLRLQSELRFEPAAGDTFPHIYGEVNTDAVVGIVHLRRGDDDSLKFAEP